MSSSVDLELRTPEGIRVKVHELPSMTINSIESVAGGIVVRGVFDRLDGVRESGWLWPGPGRYVFCDPKINRATGEAVFTVSEAEEMSGVSVGDRLPWFDGYWRVPVVQGIIDPSHAWRRVDFQANDATYFRLGHSIGWQEVGGKLPEGAVEIGVKPGGWDHEHCDLCLEAIDAAKPIGYVDEDGWWLCSNCHDRYAATQDVSFQLGA